MAHLSEDQFAAICAERIAFDAAKAGLDPEAQRIAFGPVKRWRWYIAGVEALTAAHQAAWSEAAAAPSDAVTMAQNSVDRFTEALAAAEAKAAALAAPADGDPAPEWPEAALAYLNDAKAKWIPRLVSSTLPDEDPDDPSTPVHLAPLEALRLVAENAEARAELAKAEAAAANMAANFAAAVARDLAEARQIAADRVAQIRLYLTHANASLEAAKACRGEQARATAQVLWDQGAWRCLVEALGPAWTADAAPFDPLG